MTTSASPASILPTRELLLTLGQGGQNPEPIGPPVINSFSGTFAQGNEITLSGSFSAEMNGQVEYITGDPSRNGELADKLVGFDGNRLPSEYSGLDTYRYDTTRSFSKSGASLKAKFVDGDQQSFLAGNQNVFLPARSKKLFISFHAYLNLDNWDITEYGPQVKLSRLCSRVGTYNGKPQLHLQIISVDDRYNPAIRLEAWDNDKGTFIDPDTGADWSRSAAPRELNKNWNRFVMYGEVPDPITNSNGRRFGRIIEHRTNRQIPVEHPYIASAGDPNPSLSWLAPQAHSTEVEYGNEDFAYAMLPDGQLGIPGMEAWVDCIYVNNTAERVELGNAPVMDDCTKLVVQKQISRVPGEIAFEVEEGNFTPADSIYAFVVNDDTQYSEGVLIRGGI